MWNNSHEPVSFALRMKATSLVLSEDNELLLPAPLKLTTYVICLFYRKTQYFFKFRFLKNLWKCTRTASMSSRIKGTARDQWKSGETCVCPIRHVEMTIKPASILKYWGVTMKAHKCINTCFISGTNINEGVYTCHLGFLSARYWTSVWQLDDCCNGKGHKHALNKTLKGFKRL